MLLISLVKCLIITSQEENSCTLDMMTITNYNDESDLDWLIRHLNSTSSQEYDWTEISFHLELNLGTSHTVGGVFAVIPYESSLDVENDSRMVTCGHQFHVGDECDWLISSSAVCPVNGSLSATTILKKLIEAHCKTRKEDTFGNIDENTKGQGGINLPFYIKSENLNFEHKETNKFPELILEAKEIPLTVQNQKRDTRDRAVSDYYMPEYYDSDDIDEEQHLDGCPVKWFYRKRTKNGWGPCVALKRNPEGNYKEQSGKKFRDRIPLEVKIGKISLSKRQQINESRNINGKKHEIQSDLEKCRRFEIDPKVIEIQKKKLEAKLNWRPFQEEDDEEQSVISYDRSSKDGGYLRQKSALGGKLPLSILLFPYQQQNCFCGKGNHQKVPKITLKRVPSASQIAKSSNDSSNKIPRPKTTQVLRWAPKTQRKGKRLQLPNQMNVLFDAPKKRHVKHPANLPGIRKQAEMITKTSKRNNDELGRNNHTLTSLYYELEDKSNSGKMVDDQYLEKMIRELSMEDNLRGIRNVFNPGFLLKKKKCAEGKECHSSMSQWSEDDHFKIICKQMKFSKRTPKGGTLSEVEVPVADTFKTDDAITLQ